ncbi:uncharacterized protein J7T54_006204 [Emericellopsis cladophorae]|uniref:BHLH domain-containing protein n=1 Tax=Emericellopsis cladophorae TaxID=2686198 RepID=A0A9P9YA28_9HYPO|nr:uncharacterized protein J7T54_006204 [Emericellopsis cladophorae]KAI6785865.1 hypothetical protein J7T54_006204 [Emericellopsis cladophorae]
MAQHGFSHFGTAPNGGAIDPNNLSMGGSYNPNFSNDNFSSHANNNGGNGSSSAFLADEDLLDGLGGDQGAVQNNGQDFSGMNMGFSQDAYQAHQRNSGLRLDSNPLNGFSSTPDGDPMPSPYTAGYTGNFRHMQGMHSPMFANDVDGNDQNYMNARTRARMSQQMQRKPSNTARSPMTPKTNAMHSLSLGSNDSPNFGPQSIRTHEKSPSGQWLNTPTGSYPASYNSGFASPLQGTMVPPIEEVMGKAGTSMPAKLGNTNGSGSTAVSSQEAKRKRRRESHNLVERRRRDNINERIQDLSKLVPMHRLEDEKIRKLIQNGTPLSPTLTGMSNPSSATSGLAGPGARRATGSNAGNITTGLPIEDKDKGPNKGDILNGAVSWTRDLMWMLHLKLQQQEELMQTLNELGHPYPFEVTDDERRMQSELIEAMSKNDAGNFSYTRTAGSGLRVPSITDYRGNAANADVPPTSLDTVGVTPPHHSSSAIIDDDTNQFWHDPDDNGTGHAPIDFKDDDDYGMDLN